jgi:LysM repeat protein
MGQGTEELSTTPRDIEATRADLSRNIDELTDKVSPQRVMERRKEAARSRLASVREKVMGSGTSSSSSSTGGRVSGLTSSAGDAASSVKGSAQSAVGSLESTTAGNPLVAGAVAFGAGMIISALLPASEKESQAAGRLVDAAKEHAQPLVDEAKSVGQEMGKDLGESAAEAAQQVKSQAQDSVQNVKDEGQSSVSQVKDQATPSS